MNPSNKVKRNTVINRFLPIPESVLKGLESEPKISDFDLIKEIGVGSYGRVILVKHKKTQAQYAIKAIDKRNKVNIKEKPYFRREIEIMYRVHHPNVVKLFGHFEDNNFCYFIMEYIPGGNIYNLVPKDGIRTASTQQIVSIMKDVIAATYFLHHMIPPIIHRDIKPENVVLDLNMVAKLTDFGWSNYMQGDIKRTTVCGTPIYLAPEIINNQGHDEKVDIWCIGVLMFELMTGYSPFQGDDVRTVKYNISKLKIRWPAQMDRDARDLISKILRYNPYERISLEQMLLHPFFTKYYPNAISCLKQPDHNIQYKVFIVSKDNPLTWNPILGANNYGTQNKNYSNNFSNDYNYNNLLQKYDNLEREYNNLQSSEYTNNTIDSLRRQLKEKEDQINQYSQSNVNVGYNNYNINNNALRETYHDLVNENYELKNQLNLYETQYNNTQNNIYFDNDFNQIRNSITQNNKDDFNQAMNNLQNNLDSYTQNNYNTIIMMKDREIEKYKEEDRLRREREQKELNAMINRYDQDLMNGERENQELKRRLKELEGYFV